MSECYENTAVYQELGAGFDTQFYDLGSHVGDEVLSADSNIAYPAGQKLARVILMAGGNGVLYPSARRECGQCLSAFRPHLVKNVRLGKTWSFSWVGTPEPEIERI